MAVNPVAEIGDDFRSELIHLGLKNFAIDASRGYVLAARRRNSR